MRGRKSALSSSPHSLHIRFSEREHEYLMTLVRLTGRSVSEIVRDLVNAESLAAWAEQWRLDVNMQLTRTRSLLAESATDEELEAAE